MFTIGLSNLPPGVTMDAIERALGGDDFVLPPRCPTCGRWLGKSIRREHVEDVLDCDGSVELVPEAYTEGLIAILGEEFRGKTYDIAVSPCGIDHGPHEPHREVIWGIERLTFVCSRDGEVAINY